MKTLFFSVLICGLLFVSTTSAKKNQKIPELKILSWDQLSSLPKEHKASYIIKLGEAISLIEPNKKKKSANTILLDLILGQIAAAGINDPPTCVEAGNPGTGYLGNCSIIGPTRFCGRTLTCSNPDEVPCNPLLFGFNDMLTTNRHVFHIRKVNTTDGPRYEARAPDIERPNLLLPNQLTSQGEGIFIHNPNGTFSPKYSQPICVQGGAGNTRLCVNKSIELAGNNPELMKIQMRFMYFNSDAQFRPDAPCNVEADWKKLVEGLQTACGSNNCAATMNRANIIYQEALKYQNQAPGPQRFLNPMGTRQ